MISASWVSFQLSLAARITPLLSCNSRVGSASASDTGRIGIRERRTNGAQEDAGAAASDNKTTNHDVVAGLDKAASADVDQLGVGRLIQIVRFNERYAGAAVFSADDRGVIAGIEHGNDGRFEIIGRRDAVAMISASCVSFQLLFVTTTLVGSCSSRIGSARAPATGGFAVDREGPMARKRIFFGWVPVTIKPPMRTLSPVRTLRRVEMLSEASSGGVGVGVGVGVVWCR